MAGLWQWQCVHVSVQAFVLPPQLRSSQSVNHPPGQPGSQPGPDRVKQQAGKHNEPQWQCKQTTVRPHHNHTSTLPFTTLHMAVCRVGGSKERWKESKEEIARWKGGRTGEMTRRVKSLRRRSEKKKGHKVGRRKLGRKDKRRRAGERDEVLLRRLSREKKGRKDKQRRKVQGGRRLHRPRAQFKYFQKMQSSVFIPSV